MSGTAYIRGGMTTTTTYSITNGDGTIYYSGMSRDRAHARAREEADEHGEPFFVRPVGEESDGDEDLGEQVDPSEDDEEDDEELVQRALEHLGDHSTVHSFERATTTLYLYREAQTGWWLVDADDLADLGRRLAGEADAYSLWCSDTSASEVDPGEIARTIGPDANLDALRDAAGAADDMVTYMALRFLREDVERAMDEMGDEG